MKKNLLLALLITPLLSFAQLQSGISNQQLGFTENGSVRTIQSIQSNKNLNPFLFQKWSTGYIQLKDDVNHSKDKMHFNLESGKVTLESPSGKSAEFFEVDSEMISSFGIRKPGSDKMRIFTKINKADFQNQGEASVSFYEVFSSNEGNKPYLIRKIYKKEVEIKAGNTGNGGYTGASNEQTSGTKMKKYRTFYALNKEGKYVKTKLSKKKLLKLFPDKKNELKKYIKDNDIDASKTDGASEVIKYYHSL
ncbi:hypothetical protein [Aureivirga marina]|uniref:hypothetical protein n=1 Tax=Aureivirga marina TaxID=1182451 RepID=UPI0018CBC544|nr:hypothetical protein [Aureivirga marina]